MFDAPTIPNPDLNTSEILPSAWQEYAEKHFLEPDIWPIWRAFKNKTRFPFERKRWQAWVDACVRNRKERRYSLVDAFHQSRNRTEASIKPPL